MPLGVTYGIRVTKETKSLICNVDEKLTTWGCASHIHVYYIVNLNSGENKQKFTLGIDGIVMLLTSPDGSVIFAEMEF